MKSRDRMKATKRGRTTEFPRLLGGRLCLHFANTIEGQLSDHPHDFLTSYTALARWSFHVGALEQADTDRLIRVATSQPDDAAQAAGRALELRAAIDGTFRRLASTHNPREQDLAVLQQAHAEALANAYLTPHGDGFTWSWDHQPDDLRRPLWLVTQSAIELLTTGQLHRIRKCPGAIGGCDWLFYDTSKNATRRWCSMEGCGSRVKARRQYERHQRRSHTRPNHTPDE